MGEAGALTTHSEELAEKVRILRNYGSKIRYHNELQGGNWRIDELQAGLLTMKLQYLQAWNAQRCQMARWYFDALSDIPDLDLPVTAYGCSHVYHLFVIQTSRRDALQQFLTQNGVGTLIHYPIPPHLQEAYRGHLSYREGDFPIAEQLAKRCLSLPLYIGLQEAEITYICQQIRRFFHA
jgi:dTDP-4-amino-4,6-dideoxygalactose transaminase